MTIVDKERALLAADGALASLTTVGHGFEDWWNSLPAHTQDSARHFLAGALLVHLPPEAMADDTQDAEITVPSEPDRETRYVEFRLGSGQYVIATWRWDDHRWNDQGGMRRPWAQVVQLAIENDWELWVCPKIP